jgi:pathogenesis-related protein 1
VLTCGCALVLVLRADSDIASSMLSAHAAVRASVGVPPLQWSSRLAGEAQRWANELLKTNAFEPEHDLQYGQDLFDKTGGTAQPEEVVRAWAQEVQHYDAHTNTCSGRCGHYLQVVWRDTKDVGCAAATGGGRQVWVCDYSPPGNIVGERPY